MQSLTSRACLILMACRGAFLARDSMLVIVAAAGIGLPIPVTIYPLLCVGESFRAAGRFAMPFSMA
jgi:hypothetical protein